MSMKEIDNINATINKRCTNTYIELVVSKPTTKSVQEKEIVN